MSLMGVMAAYAELLLIRLVPLVLNFSLSLEFTSMVELFWAFARLLSFTEMKP